MPALRRVRRMRWRSSGGGFFGGGFGPALAMGAGFWLGEEIIEDVF